MSTPDDPPPAPPAIPERFAFLEELGCVLGARLVRATDTLLQREVVLKLVPNDSASAGGDPQAVSRVLREARALARIDHPAVHGLLDVSETPTGIVLVLEPSTGETLAARLDREGRLEPEDVLDLGIALAGALEVVHAAGILHRGVHAENIRLEAGRSPTLSGFDLAKAAPDARGAAPSSMNFSPGQCAEEVRAHPAPEQLTRRQEDPRADLFGLGWVLYTSLTGQPPYQGANPLEWREPPDVRARIPSAPRELARVLASCLSLSPAARPTSAAAVRTTLESARAAPPAAAAEPAPAAPGAHSLKWAGAAVVAGLLLAYLLSARPLARDGDEREPQRGVVAVGPARPPEPTEPPARPWGSAPRYEHSRALLIGVGQAYSRTGFPALQNAERDTTAVAEALGREKGHTWDISTLLGDGATRESIINHVAQLADRSGPDDRVLIFFAGHGKAHERAEGSGWLIPAGARPGAAGRPGWVRFDEFFRFFKEARAKHILIAMDCCYGGRLVTSRSAGAQAFAERFLTRPAHVIITSGRGDEEVSDGAPGGHSPFAKALVAALHTPGRPLTTTMLFAEIQHAVLESGIAQTPVYGYPEGSPVGGEVVFFREE